MVSAAASHARGLGHGASRRTFDAAIRQRPGRPLRRQRLHVLPADPSQAHGRRAGHAGDVLSFAALVVWWDGEARGRVTTGRWLACGGLLAALALTKGPQPVGFFALGVGGSIGRPSRGGRRCPAWRSVSDSRPRRRSRGQRPSTTRGTSRSCSSTCAFTVLASTSPTTCVSGCGLRAASRSSSCRAHCSFRRPWPPGGGESASVPPRTRSFSRSLSMPASALWRSWSGPVPRPDTPCPSRLRWPSWRDWPSTTCGASADGYSAGAGDCRHPVRVPGGLRDRGALPLSRPVQRSAPVER